MIGAIDCTHITITGALGEHEGDFVNRKSFHNINVQVNHLVLIVVRCLLQVILTLLHRVLSQSMKATTLHTTLNYIFVLGLDLQPSPFCRAGTTAIRTLVSLYGII